MEIFKYCSKTKISLQLVFLSGKLIFTCMLGLFSEHVHCNSIAHTVLDNTIARSKATLNGAVVMQRAGRLVTGFRIHDYGDLSL